MVPTPNHKPQKKNTIFFFTLHTISVNIFIYIWDLVEWGRKKQHCNINHHFYIMTFSLWYMYIVLYSCSLLEFISYFLTQKKGVHPHSIFIYHSTQPGRYMFVNFSRKLRWLQNWFLLLKVFKTIPTFFFFARLLDETYHPEQFLVEKLLFII